MGKEEESDNRDKFYFFKASWDDSSDVLEWDMPSSEAVPLAGLSLVLGLSKELINNESAKIEIQKAYNELTYKPFLIDFKTSENRFFSIQCLKLDSANEFEYALYHTQSNTQISLKYLTASQFIENISNLTEWLKMVELSKENVLFSTDDFVFEAEIIEGKDLRKLANMVELGGEILKIVPNDAVVGKYKDGFLPAIRLSISLAPNSPVASCYVHALLLNNDYSSFVGIVPVEGNLDIKERYTMANNRIQGGQDAKVPDLQLNQSNTKVDIFGYSRNFTLEHFIYLADVIYFAYAPVPTLMFIKILVSNQPIDYKAHAIHVNNLRRVEDKVIYEQKISFDPNWSVFTFPIKAVKPNFKEGVEKLYKEKRIIVADDLQKARWGGKNEANGYKLSANVAFNNNNLSNFSVTVKLESPYQNDTQPAAIFLHSTFTNEINYVDFENGKAQVTVSAYEAFTTGAYLSDGTMLELDLQRQEGYPKEFYYKFVADILWVDDRPQTFNRSIIKELEKQGFVFYEALNSEEVIALLETQKFDLIISDMVRGDNQRAGMDLLKYCKAKGMSIPTVIYSSNLQIDDFKKEAIELGAMQVMSGSKAKMIAYIKNFFPKPTDSAFNFQEKIQKLYQEKRIIVADDLQKARWGGKSEVNGYQISAGVVFKSARNYEINSVIQSPNENDTRQVAIFLHSTFPNEIRYTSFKNGKAELTVSAFEAFTLGAYLEDSTMLELDLNRQGNYPKEFYCKFVADILWVDDNPNNNKAIVKQLSKEGFVFYEVLSTNEALEVLKDRKFDLIISDMVRGEDKEAGMELLTKLKEDNIFIPIVICTSEFSVNIFKHQALKMGVLDIFHGKQKSRAGFIKKHFSKTALS